MLNRYVHHSNKNTWMITIESASPIVIEASSAKEAWQIFCRYYNEQRESKCLVWVDDKDNIKDRYANTLYNESTVEPWHWNTDPEFGDAYKCRIAPLSVIKELRDDSEETE